jgi:hypothetical protein
MVIKSVGVVSVGKMYGAVCAAMGLLGGVFIAALGSVSSSLASAAGTSVMPFAGFGVAAIIVLPIIYGFIGFIGGLIGGAFYNLFAGMVGGIEIETT